MLQKLTKKSEVVESLANSTFTYLFTNINFMPKTTYFSKISAWAYDVYVSFKGKRIPLFVWLIWGLLVFSTIGSLLQAQYSVTFISVLTLLSTFVPYLFQRRYKLYIPSSVVSLITLFLYAAIFLGESQNFYAKFWWWDVILHVGSAVGFGLIGVVILLLLYGLFFIFL